MEGSLLKAQLRKELRLRRQGIESAARRSLDDSINKTLLELVKNTGCLSLSAYWPFDGEPDLRPSMDILSRRGLTVALPVIDDAADEPRLQFRHWSHSKAMKKNLYGIEEPGSGDILLPKDLDLVLLPLVAWDEYGHRLGMGRGYYDRTLETLAESIRPLRVGIAYESQKVADVPADPWDIGLHNVITEKGRFTCAA